MQLSESFTSFEPFRASELNLVVHSIYEYKRQYNFISRYSCHTAVPCPCPCHRFVTTAIVLVTVVIVWVLSQPLSLAGGHGRGHAVAVLAVVMVVVVILCSCRQCHRVAVVKAQWERVGGRTVESDGQGKEAGGGVGEGTVVEGKVVCGKTTDEL
jgi:hypothetical protein